MDNNYYPNSSCSLEQWQAATGCDANSLSTDPLFVGADDTIPDLHITASSPMINKGTSVYPLVVDIDDDIRDRLPDIGYDEFYTSSVVIGEGQTYTTLKQAFDAINDGIITGNISINLQSRAPRKPPPPRYTKAATTECRTTPAYLLVRLPKNITVSGNITKAPIVSFNGHITYG